MKVFDIDFRKGSLIEWVSKGVGVNVGNSFSKTEKGITYRALQTNLGEVTIEAADSSNLNFGTSPFSMVCAFKKTKNYSSIGSNRQSIFFKGQGINYGTIGLLYKSDESIRWCWGDYSVTNNSELTLDDFGNPNDGKFHLTILVFDGTTFRAYYDNVKETTESTTIRNINSDSSKLYIGRDSNSLTRSNCDVLYIKGYDHALSTQERDKLYQDFLNSSPTGKPTRGFEYPESYIGGIPYLIEDFSNHPVGDTSPKGWVKGTGVYEVKESVDNGKYLECTTSGTTAIQSKQSYGTWEFSVYKGADENILNISLLSPTNDNKNYYRLFINGVNNVALVMINPSTGIIVGDLFWTKSSYVSSNTWYRIKVARLQSEGTFVSIIPSMTTTYPANTFAVFIKGGVFGDEWTLVNVTGGVGLNPVTNGTYTTSEYFVADLDAGDKITNIKLYNQVAQ